MSKLADDLAQSSGNGSAPHVARQVADLAVEMRGTVTPVIGYLELISQEGHPGLDDRHLHWIATIERRLEAMHELNDQILRVCAVLRESVSESEAATPPDPEALAD